MAQLTILAGVNHFVDCLEAKIEFIIDIAAITSEVPVESGAHFLLHLLLYFLTVCVRTLWFWVVVAQGMKKCVQLGASWPVLAALEIHVQPRMAMHGHISAHVKLLGVEHLVVIRVTIQFRTVKVECLGEKISSLNIRA